MIEIGTLKELNVKPGDVVSWHKAAPGYEYQDNRFAGVGDWVVSEYGSVFNRSTDQAFGRNCNHKFRIVSRASDDTHSSCVKPDEPVRETFTHEQWVSMHEESDRGAFSLLFGPSSRHDTKGQTTIETVDGKPIKIVWEASDYDRA